MTNYLKDEISHGNEYPIMMTPDLFEDVVRLYHNWKRKPTFIKPKLRYLMTFSKAHQASRVSIYHWGITAVRFGIQAKWLLKQHMKKTKPPPFARSILEVMFAKALSSGGLSTFETGLAMTVLKRHFPPPIYKWAYHVLSNLKQVDEPKRLQHGPPYVQAGLPQWIFERLLSGYEGSEKDFAQLCMQKNRPHPVSVRIDPRRFTQDEGTPLLKETFSDDQTVQITPQDSNNLGFYIKGAGRPIEELPLFKDGSISIQSESSIVIGKLIQQLIQKEKKASRNPISLLDMAASPGGKTLLLWQLAKDTPIHLTAMARDEKAYEVLMRNLKRDKTCKVHAFVHDVTIATKPPTVERFDWVICDAPCSNLGTLFSKPDVKYIHQENDFDHLMQVQLSFLNKAVSLLKPNGTLVYVVCSQEPEETEEVIRVFLKMFPDFKTQGPQSLSKGLTSHTYGMTFDWFERPYWDGYYISVLKRRG